MMSPTSLRCGTTGRAVLLGSPIGPPGAEGRVYAIAGQPGQVAKLYHRDRLTSDRALEAKLTAMVAAPPAGIREPVDHWALAWPSAVLREAGDAFVGFTMPAVQSSRAAQWHMLANPSDRDDPPPSRPWTPGFDWRYRLHACANLADAVGSLLDAGYVPGDLSGDNIFVYRNALITVIDIDSMQVPAPGGGTYHCSVWRDEYLAPELAGRRDALHRTVRKPPSALFALAVLIYEMLMEGRHPFGGVWSGPGEPPSRLSLSKQGCFVNGPDSRLRRGPGALKPGVLPPEMRALFTRAFVRGATQPASRPSCSEWRRCLHRAAAAARTGQHCSHPYPAHLDACPWCRREAKAERPHPPKPTTPPKPAAAPRSRKPTATTWPQGPAAPPRPPNPFAVPRPPTAPRPPKPAATPRPQGPAGSVPAPATPASPAPPYPSGVRRRPASPTHLRRLRWWVLPLVALVAFSITLGVQRIVFRSGSSSVAVFNDKIADNAPIGTCIATKQAWDGNKSAVTSVPCDQPHWGEILGYPRLAPVPSPYPGVEQLWGLAEFRCGQLFAGRAGLNPAIYAYTVVYPDRPSWNDSGNQEENYATCAVYARDNGLTTGQLVRADQPVRTDVSVPMNVSGAPAGACVETWDSIGRSLPESPIVDCERPHWGEILAHPVLYSPSTPWPGDAAAIAAADAACRTDFEGRRLAPQYTYHALYPGQAWWSSPPERGISATCLAYRTDNQQFTGPAR